jgi:cobalt-zinc-cadmium efflux system outer membrane protein
MIAGRGVAGWALALALMPLPAGAETFGLRQLEDMAAGHPALKAAAQGVEAARGGVQGARAFPNPEVEYLAGSMRYRPGIQGTSGGSASVSVSQALDLPFRRTAY